MIIYHVRPKRKSTCKFCDTPILKGEEAIRYPVKFGKFTKYRIEHWKCFIAFSESLYAKHPPVRESRKCKIDSAFRKEYNKLLTLARYYRRTGNTAKAEENQALANRLIRKEWLDEHPIQRNV